MGLIFSFFSPPPTPLSLATAYTSQSVTLPLAFSVSREKPSAGQPLLGTSRVSTAASALRMYVSRFGPPATVRWLGGQRKGKEILSATPQPQLQLDACTTHARTCIHAFIFILFLTM